MTARDAKARVLELWGERGLLGRIALIGTLIGMLWVGVTAMKGTVEIWLVPQRQAQETKDSLNAFFTRQQIADIQWKAEDRAFKNEMRTWRHQECVRRYGPTNCIQTTP